MKKINDIPERILKTFLQGFISSAMILLSTSDFSEINVFKSILIGALAGGLSAVMNLFQNYLNEEGDK